MSILKRLKKLFGGCDHDVIESTTLLFSQHSDPSLPELIKQINIEQQLSEVIERTQKDGWKYIKTEKVDDLTYDLVFQASR